MDQQLSSYRVFVGGLFPSVTNEDLSGRFKSFGNVTDVVVIQRKDDEGRVSKTFGYVSLESTLSKLNKCFALFGGTKWKGHSLKVQLAKEDFMARLEKERSYPEQFIKKSKRKHVEPMKKYEDFVSKSSAMKRAVPGTPVQGEKDWVVGKYGRPLPVVAIRKWAGQKLVKVDPSKHCHCLKKITLNETDVEADISDLTWTLNDDQGDNSIMKNQKRKKKKEKHHYVEEHKCSKKKKEDSDVENEFECSSMKHSTNGEFQESVSPAKKNKRTDKADITSKTKNKIGLKNADQETPSQKKEKLKSVGVKKDPIKTTMLPLDSISFNEESNKKEDSRNVILEKECIFTESIEVGKNEYSDSEDVPNDNNLSMSIVEQLLNRSKPNSVRMEEVVQKSPTPDILHPESDDNNSESEYENVNLFDFTFDNLKNSTTLYSYDVTSSVVKKNEDSSLSESESSDQSINVQQNKVETIGKGDKTKSQSTEDNAPADSVDSSKTTQKQKPASQRKESNQQQKILSEEARINSLKLREQKSLQNKEAVKAALRSIDTSSNSRVNRIVFSESESESENVDPRGNSTQSTLMSGDNSDEESFKKNLFEDSESEDEEVGGIQLKPQFQGEEGQKLFKLQQRFGGDERFRLDERFAENGGDKQADKSNDGENMDSLDTDDLHQEKQMNLNVLEQVLGKSLDESGAKQKKNTRDKTFERYDPTSENHEKFEIARKKETERQINNSGDEEEEDEEVEKKKMEDEKKNMEPTVSTEQFFSVNKSLKELFSGSKQETFSFLSSASNTEENEVQEEEEKEEEEKVSTKEVSWMKALDEAAKYPGDEEMQETAEETAEIDETDKKCVTFFFTKDDERFKSGKDFVRTNTMEEITSQWEALRKNLYEDSRKKHKDAVRRIRKLKDRKFTST